MKLQILTQQVWQGQSLDSHQHPGNATAGGALSCKAAGTPCGGSSRIKEI